jgi:hypothetical protein
MDEYPKPPVGVKKEMPKLLAQYKHTFDKGGLPEGPLIALRDAIEMCAWYGVPPPKWIADAVAQLCYQQIEADRRPGRLGSYHARLKQHRIHLVRWATVKHLRENCRERARTWNDAFAEASRELQQTIAQGGEEAIAASYKSFARSWSKGLISELDGKTALAEIAQSYFEGRHALLSMFTRDQGRKR